MFKLIVNPGSTSKRFALFDEKDNSVFTAHIEKIGEKYILHLNFKDNKGNIEISKDEFHNPYKNLFELFLGEKIIQRKDDIEFIGLRIVAPGKLFQQHHEINNKYLDDLVEIRDTAPLHIDAIIEEIKNIKKLSKAIKIIGISDTEFHKSIPDKFRYYGINKSDADKNDLVKFGYHGLSISSILSILKKDFSVPKKIIICHLGGGGSVTAVLDSKSINNSMGYSPLDGILMSNRVGNIDPEIIIKLAELKNLNYDELEKYLNTECGLFGISEISGDPRILLTKETHDINARLALDIYASRVQEYIGRYVAVLNGVDMIVFSGGVGERSAPLRERICENLEFFGIKLDSSKNKKAYEVNEIISHKESRVQILTIKSDEMREMLKILNKNMFKSNLRLIISRHGQTEYNLSDKFQGRSDSPLTEKGILQAKNLNKFLLNNFYLSRFYISPLKRVISTSNLVNKKIGAEIIQTPNLLEVCYGDWEEKSRENINSEILKQREKDRFNFIHPGKFKDIKGESYKIQYDRVSTFLEDMIYDEHNQNKDIGVIAHHGVMLSAYKFFNEMSDEEMNTMRFDNDQILVVTIKEGKVKCEVVKIK